EILALNNGVWKIFDVDAGYNLSERITLSEQGDGNNIYGVPVALYDDFNGNGEPEIVVCDVDGDLLVYERSGESFPLLWTTRLGGKGGESLLVSADVDGDGRKEIVAAVRNQPPILLESNVNDKFWALTVWKAADQSSYQLLAEKNVHGVTVQSGIHNGMSATDVDNNGTDEIIFLPFPDGYLFTLDGNELQMLWYQDEINSNSAVLQDFTGDGRRELMLNTTSGLRYWFQVEAGSRPASPTQTRAVALNETQAFVEWRAVPGADIYRIYRNVAGRNILVDSSQSNIKIISELSVDTSYVYSVSTVDLAFPEPESLPGKSVNVQPNAAPEIVDTKVENSRQVSVGFSEPMSGRTFDVSRWSLNGESPVSVARAENSRQALLSFDNPFVNGENSLLIIRHEDKSGTPGRDSLIVNFMFMQPNPSLYLTSYELLTKSQLRLNFNQPVDVDDATRIQNYQIEPEIGILKAEVAGAEVLLTLVTPNRLGALGEPHLLVASDIRGVDGAGLNQNGASLEISRIVTDLSEVIVYPNPWTSKNQPLRFANLPKESEVYVFTANGSLVRTMKNDNPFGALTWDGRNESGNRVASGIYVYLIRLDGVEKKGKLMIVN
ncbi:MAG: FG-GAP-like repeat-containing protein, partial [Calditrichota bacterium]